MNKNNYSSRQKGLFQLTPKEIIGYVMKPPPSPLWDVKETEIFLHYFKNKERFFLTSISSNSFLVLMNSSADRSSFDRRKSSLVKANESKTQENLQLLALPSFLKTFKMPTQSADRAEQVKTQPSYAPNDPGRPWFDITKCLL